MGPSHRAAPQLPAGIALLLVLLRLAASTSAAAPRVDGEAPATQWEAGDGPAGVSLPSLGNHRVRVSCPAGADAVTASVEWRRPDSVPASHGVLITRSATARKSIQNVSIINVTRVAGLIAFDRRNGINSGRQAEFFIYWLPFTRNHLGQWGAVAVSYDPPKHTASSTWEAANVAYGRWQRLPRCTVVAYEARDVFNRFTAMEVVATSDEMAKAAAQAHGSPFLVFPEDRAHAVRDFDRIPTRFLSRAAATAAGRCHHYNGTAPPPLLATAVKVAEPHDCDVQLRFAASAKPGEFFVLQLVVWALRDTTGLQVRFEPLKANVSAPPRQQSEQRISVSNITSINTQGTNYLGQNFKKDLNVTAGKVQPLWIGVNIPQDLPAATKLSGTFTVVAADGTAVPVQIELTIASGPPLQDHGDSDPQALTRLRWLDSTVGIDNEPPLGFAPIELNPATKTAVLANGKMLVIHPVTGFPQRIMVGRELRRNPKAAITPLEVLAAPIELLVRRQPGSVPVKWCAARHQQERGTGVTSTVESFQWRLQARGIIAWTARLIPCSNSSGDEGGDGPLQLEVNGTLEFDGYMDYSVALSCSSSGDDDGGGDNTLHVSGTCSLDTVELQIPFSHSASQYTSGLGQRGAVWPPPAGASSRRWGWAEFANATKHGVPPPEGWIGWVGAVSHGLRLKLKGEDQIWEQPSGGYTALMPMGWAGADGNGTLSLSTEAAAVLSAKSLQRSMKPGGRVHFKFDLVTTPVKQRDSKHFKWRYLMGCGGCDYPGGFCKPATLQSDWNVTQIGVNAVILHQGCSNNPYINWPWGSGPSDPFPGQLKSFVVDRHQKGVRTLMYYTTRELSNQAAELHVLRSLGQEIIRDGDVSRPGGIPAIPHGAGGVSWLQEHLRKNYTPGWTTLVYPNKTDAAVGDIGASRWGNYYVEGMRNLACETGVDGANFDGLNYPRHTMARLRKVTESCRQNATLFNMHGGDGFRSSRLSTVLAYTAHYSFIDSLMDGEQFNYSSGHIYHLLELSGLPFGMMNDLYGWTGGIGIPNLHYGALYGMNARLPNGPGLEVIESVWHLWDALDLAEFDMYGYWDEDTPVKVIGGGGHVLATAFVQPGNATFIPIANFAQHAGKAPPQNITLSIDWAVLGLDKRNISLCAPQVVGIQTKLPQEAPYGLYADGEMLSITNGGGLWLVLTTRPIIDVYATGQPLGCCTGQPPPIGAQGHRNGGLI